MDSFATTTIGCSAKNATQFVNINFFKSLTKLDKIDKYFPPKHCLENPLAADVLCRYFVDWDESTVGLPL